MTVELRQLQDVKPNEDRMDTTPCCCRWVDSVSPKRACYEMLSARWIGGPGNVFVRRDIYLGATPVSAKLHIVADPHSYANEFWMKARCNNGGTNWLLGGSFLKYRIWINGVQIGAGPFRPVDDSIPALHAFDLTPFLSKGLNAIGVLSRGERCGFALAIRIELADGSTEIIRSDSTWQQLSALAVFSPVCWERQNISQYFKGFVGPGEWAEHIDGEHYPFGWLEPGFPDDGWHQAIDKGPFLGPCEAESRLCYEQRTLHPALIKINSAGHFLVDFGREVIASFELTCPMGGAIVEIRLGEELLDEDSVMFQMRTGNCYQEIWRFPYMGGTLSNFGVRAFRYAEIIGWPGELSSSQVKALSLNAPFNMEASSFESSNEALMQVWDLCRNTIAWTTLDVYTDCPSRERITYEADTYITMLTHFAVSDDIFVAKRSIEYQLNHGTWPCEWRQFIIPIVYEYVMHTGDLDFLENYYEMLKRDYSYHCLSSGELVEEFPLRIIVDWPEGSRDGYVFGPHNAVANAFVYWDLTLLSELAALLGRNAESEDFKILARNIKAAFNETLFNSCKGLYRDNSRTDHCSFHANVFALNFGLVPEDRIDACLQYIVEKGMACSVYLAQFMLEALFKNGRADYAVNLMSAKGSKSWIGMIKQGATTTTEAWSPRDKSNMSWAHPWASSPANIIVRHLFGLKPGTPGWRNIVFDPKPGGVKSAKILISTPSGRINASFELDMSGKIIKKLERV